MEKQIRETMIIRFVAVLIFAMALSFGIASTGQAAAKFETISSKGVKTCTDDFGEYSGNYGDTEYSYLYHNADGTYNRVECQDEYLYSEIYTENFKYRSGKKIKLELPLWGGVYITSDAYYVLLGKNNEKKKKNVPEFRIIKYDKNWKKLASKDIMNANTAIPFDAGSCRFVEMDGDLYVRTCHEMYNGHQASVMMRIRMSDLEILACQANVANIGYGYISHSFNQFLDKKNGKIYACDHGDAFDRGITMMRFEEKIKGKDFFDNLVTPGNAFTFYGETGNNFTGATLGGFAVSDTHCISVGSSLKQTKSGVKKSVYNIYVATMQDTGAITDDLTEDGKPSVMVKSLQLADGKANLTWITNYSSKGKRTVGNPKLVRITDSRFLLIWDEKYKDNDDCTRYCFLDGTGKKVSEIKTVYAKLSDCQPIVVGDRVVWYTTMYSSPIFYSLSLNNEKLPVPKVKTKFTKLGVKYQVTKSSAKKGEVKVIGYKKSQMPEEFALNTVDYGGYRFKITAIDKNAFKNCKKIKTVCVGTNVKKIGARAFYGCSKLTTLILENKKYTSKSIGKKAFAKINRGALIAVSKKKLSAYKKLLKKKGVPDGVWIEGWLK